uniref:Uncharacterized protein n=1 Tax=Oryza glumipatula TaxID=40148 RepID=A0A0E0AA85_9ORYZ
MGGGEPRRLIVASADLVDRGNLDGACEGMQSTVFIHVAMSPTRSAASIRMSSSSPSPHPSHPSLSLSLRTARRIRRARRRSWRSSARDAEAELSSYGIGPTAEVAEQVLRSRVCYSRPKSAVRFFV